MSWWFVAFWFLWGAMFVVAETIAIKRKKAGDTLSETVWWLQEKGRIFTIPVFKWFLIGMLLWLFVHFIFRGFDVYLWR